MRKRPVFSKSADLHCQVFTIWLLSLSVSFLLPEQDTLICDLHGPTQVALSPLYPNLRQGLGWSQVQTLGKLSTCLQLPNTLQPHPAGKSYGSADTSNHTQAFTDTLQFYVDTVSLKKSNCNKEIFTSAWHFHYFQGTSINMIRF